MDTLLCNDDGDIVIGTYDPSNTLLRLSADQYTTGSATWADQSGNGLDFTVSTNASLKGTDADGFPYMNFSGSYGYAQRLVGGVLTNIPAPTTGKYTIFCVTQILNSTSNYRTLTRGATADHQILIHTGNNNLGLYDNSGSNWLDSGFDVTTAMTSSRNLLTWELSTSSPIYKFQLNESGTNSTITSATNYTLPFASLGSVSTQYWGNIYEFIVYDGVLGASERDYVAEYLAYKWDISSKLPSLTSTHGVTTLESIGALDGLGTTIYTQTVGAYALRRLFGLYAGPQVRLRRSTDNAETDVYFNINGSIQNLNLTTWLGGGTGYVTTWYDQSGNGNNVTQATTSKQPKYVTTNKIEFIASSQHSLLRTPGVLAAGDDTYTFAGAFEPHATGTQVVCEQNSSTSISSQRACVILLSSKIGHNGQSNDAHNIVAYTLNQKNRFVMRVNNGVSPNIKLNHEGTNYTATSGSPANLNVSGYGFSIGYKLSSNSEYYDGFISEIIVFNTEISDTETNAIISLAHAIKNGPGVIPPLPPALQ